MFSLDVTWNKLYDIFQRITMYCNNRTPQTPLLAKKRTIMELGNSKGYDNYFNSNTDILHHMKNIHPNYSTQYSNDGNFIALCNILLQSWNRPRPACPTLWLGTLIMIIIIIIISHWTLKSDIDLLAISITAWLGSPREDGMVVGRKLAAF